ncbi:low-density lipoprotein receptor-related protein 6-like, partial [Mercenaria mercenaria]|uniref:low-density lipoprotein receptor-related protein 6-like n=1 Tax=Mercenaria mercenaria TaxID=6596 RepID=UPI00234EF9FF
FLQLYGNGSDVPSLSVLADYLCGSAAPSLSVLADYLYVTTRNSTVLINKFTGDVGMALGTGNVTAASLYHPVLYDRPSQVNPCDTSPCSHLCVPSNNNHGYRCLCPVDMELVTEQNCSRKENVERLLVSGITGIYEVPTEFIGNHGYQGHRLLNADVSCMVYDGVEERIFYYDDTQKALQMLQLHHSQLPSLLYSRVYQVEDIEHDPSSHVIYWTTTKGSVYVGKDDGTFSTQIISDLHRPRGITLDPETGYLYICDWGNEPQILRCYMDGTHCDTFIHVHGGHPNMVVIATPLTMETGSENRKTLYWTDSKLDVISFVNLRDDAVIWEKIQLNHSRNTHPVGLVVTDSTIYFTDWNTQYVHYMQESDVTAVMDIHLDMGSVFGMDHIQKPLQVSQTACSVENGGCTHLCLVKPEGQCTCLCPGSEENVSCTVKGKKFPPHSDLIDKLDTKKMKPVSTETKDSILLVVLPVTGVVILLLAVIVTVFCYHRHK